MNDNAEFAPGTPCWVELWTPDRPASMDFYAAVFDWHYQVAPAEQHFFTVATLNDRSVAGMITPPGNPAAPMVWITYLSVDDVDATIARVTEHGGVSLTGAITVPGDGGKRVALFADPTGAMVGAWQADGHRGAELTNEPATFVWNELWTPDPATARTFYANSFGIEIGERISPDFDYTTFLAAGRVVGGIGTSDEARWNTYFAASDTDAMAERVRGAGGTVHGAVRDSPFGRIATCTDPHGAEFFLIAAPA